MSTFDPHYQNKKLEGKIVVALERISEAFRVLLWQQGKEQGLTPLQLQLVLFIDFHPAEQCKVNYLAGEFNVTKATISESVRLLAKKELISKEADPDDSRSYSIHLSPKGKSVAKKTRSFAKSIEQPLHEFPATQKEVLYESLVHLITQLNKSNIISVQRMCHSCRFYEKGDQNDYCRFLDQPLFEKDIRMDCPEHQPAL